MEMGFNKRFVSKETIITKVKKYGVESLSEIFTPKVDAFIFMDDFSGMIYDLYLEKQYRKIECLIR